MKLSYIKTALRNLRKNKLYTGVNLLCLAVGMACCMLIAIYVKDEWSFNSFHANYKNIYRINWISKRDNKVMAYATTPAPLGLAMKQEIPQIKQLARIYQRGGDMEGKNAGTGVTPATRFHEREVYFADQSFFSVFSVEFLKGSPTGALTAPNSLVLTEEMAHKYFGDANPVGRLLLYDTKTLLQVSAVVKKLPANSDIRFDFLVNFETLYTVENEKIADFIKTDWTYNPVYSYCLINEGASIASIEKSLNTVLYKSGTERNRQLNEIYLQPLSRIHLYASEILGNPGNGNITYLYIFSAIALLILIIACVNFVNLATAQAINRTREVGVRKVLGAANHQLILQLMGETLLLSFAAWLLSFGLVQALLPLLNQLSAKQLNLHDWINPKSMLVFGGLFVLTGVSAGIYPAFFMTRFNINASLKGKTGEVKRSNLLRKTLMVFQFSVSVVLIAGAIVIYRQLHFLKNKPLGFEKENMLSIPIFGSDASTLGYGVDGPMRERMNTFCNLVLSSPRVKAITAASALPGQWYIPGLVIPEGKSENDNVFIPWLCADYDFLDVFNIPLVAGRNFSKATGSDHLSAFIINETAVKAFGWKSPADAIGKKFIRGKALDGKHGEIIGVVKDHHFGPLDQPMQPLIIDVNVPRFSFFALRIDAANTPQTLQLVKDCWDKIFPERVFEYSFLDADIENLYANSKNLSELVSFFAAVAIVLCCLGLYSLSSFLTGQRTREIGIRKVLGASVSGILLLLSKEFVKLNLIAIAIATGLAVYALNKWLQNYAYHIELQWWFFALAGCIVLLLTAITVSLQSYRAALTNPVKSLKND